MLCRQFGFIPDDITSHKEAHAAGYASNHSDPESWMKHFGDDMHQFRDRVAIRLSLDKPQEQTPQEMPAETPEDLHMGAYAKADGNVLPTLRRGNTGNVVRILQYALYHAGYYEGAVKKEFDAEVEHAVRLFQSDNRLTNDGIVGKQTWGKLLG